MDGTMNYKEYSITAYEDEPGHWFAEIRRLDGKNIELLIIGETRPFLKTSRTEYSEQAAIDESKKAIDAGGMK
jgi:hypothetical protein